VIRTGAAAVAMPARCTETVTMTTDILARNNVHVVGRGQQPLVFAHGFGCDQNMWRFVAPAFEDRYRVVLFDYVGSGKSDLAAFDPERYAALHGYAQDVREILAALELQQVIFVGHSVSSMIGMLAAIAEPKRFSRLLCIAPSPCYLNHPPDYLGGFERAGIEELLDLMDKNYLGWAGFLAPLVMGNADQPELAGELEQSFCSTDRKTARVFAQATFLSDHRQDLSRLTVPSLLLQCAEDAIAPPAVGDYLHSHLPGSTLRVLNATGHCPHMSHPAETIDAISDYLTAQA
jgi:sigma-B regulation protein RsbQ